jgi:hypothetical protein
LSVFGAFFRAPLQLRDSARAISGAHGSLTDDLIGMFRITHQWITASCR